MVNLWGRPWTRRELLARVGRLDQLAGVQLVEAGDGAERGVRLLRFTAGSGALVGIEDLDAFTARARLLAADASAQPAKT